MNAVGAWTLYRKEVKRFAVVIMQTVVAPIVMALLYLFIFGHVLDRHVEVYDGVAYQDFLVPGLVMMSIIQNAFANTSSSLIFSKITGNVVFVLLAPLSHLEFFAAFVAASVTRAFAVAAGILLAAWVYLGLDIAHPLWVLGFGLLASIALGALGLMVGIWAEKFDQVATVQNFVILPLSFLSGVFYSIGSLPELWQRLSQANPFFYMIDGFRYGFFGIADTSPWLSLAVMCGFVLLLCILAIQLLASGYKLRN